MTPPAIVYHFAMGSTFYLFYMILFTGVVLWCLFLWLVKGDEEEPPEGDDERRQPKV